MDDHISGSAASDSVFTRSVVSAGVTCPHCGGDLVVFEVPPDCRERAPGPAAAICSDCLRTAASTEEEEPTPPAETDFGRIDASFPGGEAGAATALLLGRLDSIATDRDGVAALTATAEAAGSDVWLTLDWLSSSPEVDPHFDIERRLAQLESFV